MVFMTWPGTSGNGSATGMTTDYYKNSPQQNPEGRQQAGSKVIRGGAWEHQCAKPNDHQIGTGIPRRSGGLYFPRVPGA